MAVATRSLDSDLRFTSLVTVTRRAGASERQLLEPVLRRRQRDGHLKKKKKTRGNVSVEPQHTSKETERPPPQSREGRRVRGTVSILHLIPDLRGATKPSQALKGLT